MRFATLVPSLLVAMTSINAQNNAPVRLANLPAVAQASISTALGHDDAQYRAKALKGSFRIANPAQRLAANFSSDGVEVQSGNAHCVMQLEGYGYGEIHLPLTPSVPQAELNHVQYVRGGLTEWYANGPAGLEQGFSIASPPGLSHGLPLTIDLSIAGNLKPVLGKDGKGLTLTGPEGNLAYAGLSALDADGRQLEAWLELRNARLMLRVADGNARYPILIDPIIQQAELTSSDGQAIDFFGWSVAISGNTVVVGATNNPYPTGAGAVYVFVKPSGGWGNMTQTAKLTPSDGVDGNQFGGSVAIDGDTIAVGSPRAPYPTCTGAVYIFSEPAGGWTDMTETAELTASDAKTNTFLGFDVGISGGTVVTQGQGAMYGEAAYVFVEPAGGWSNMEETAVLTASNNPLELGGNQGIAIKGGTVVVGAPLATVGENPSQGAVYVFLEPAGGWVNEQETAELTGSDDAQYSMFGTGVSITADTIVATSVGNAYIFVEPSGGWTNTTETAELLRSTDQLAPETGIAASGDTIVVGHRVFIKPPTGWVTTSKASAVLTPSNLQEDSYFGSEVGIDGGSIVVGAYFQNVTGNVAQGEAYVFGAPAHKN